MLFLLFLRVFLLDLALSDVFLLLFFLEHLGYAEVIEPPFFIVVLIEGMGSGEHE